MGDALAGPGPAHPHDSSQNQCSGLGSAQPELGTGLGREVSPSAVGGRAALSARSLSFRDFFGVTHALAVRVLPVPFSIAKRRVGTARLSENNVLITFGGCLPPPCAHRRGHSQSTSGAEPRSSPAWDFSLSWHCWFTGVELLKRVLLRGGREKPTLRRRL